MQYTALGSKQTNISKICLGCMSFGEPGSMYKWSLPYAESEKLIKLSLELGINFFDTANCYSQGTSEEYLGRALKHVDREKVVIASKVYFNEGRLSKDAIKREIEGTLKRLDTDYIDLYIIHRFDYDTPILETMQALNGLVGSGKVKMIGASAMYGYQFYDMQICAQNYGLATFSAMENHYSLLYREDERELIPICNEMNVTLMPYSPLAGGHLSNKTWDYDTNRRKTDGVIQGKYDAIEDSDIKIVERVFEMSEKYNCSMTQIALAWELAKGIHSPIVGATKAEHIEDAVKSVDVNLSSEDVAYLEELYVPHPVVGAIDKNPEQPVVLLNERK